MGRTRIAVGLFRLGLALAVSFGVAAPALALGGSAVSASTWGLGAQTVMVLGARGSVCTGTVLSRNVVVTAGHCVAGSKQIAIAYFESGEPVLQITTARATHPGFSRNAKVSVDLALLRLQENLPARFRPAKLDGGQGASEIGESLVVAGFGLSEEHNLKTAGTLRVAEVRLLPRLFPRFMRIGIDDTLERLAICKGDSGGPVYANVDGERVLVGVIYAAEKTGKAILCGATAQAVRLAPQRSWIDQVMARWERMAAR